MTTAALNRNWSQWILETCVRSGPAHFFVSPGSRSTPLAVLLGDLPPGHVTTHFDERGLAYACLGFGRAQRGVGILICTSGTAVANLLPAVVEAALDSVPMLILSADRPPELRDTGANQTIRQPHLFGDYPVWAFDLPCPTADTPAAFVRSTLRYALERCRSGPVHINCMFREPLYEPAEVKIDWPAAARQGPVPTGPITAPTAPLRLPGGPTIVIAGGGTRSRSLAAQRLAQTIDAVFVSDVTSSLHARSFELALLAEQLPYPDTVIHVGQRIVSKKWFRFLEAGPPDCYVHLSPSPARLDPSHIVTQRVLVEAGRPLPEIQLDRPCPRDFVEEWQQALATPPAVLPSEFENAKIITEPFVAHVVAEQLPDGSACYLGNSMPVRDMDAFGCWPDDRDILVTANRGASGIDGTLASAAGLAVGTRRPTMVLLGDLAFLHDLNSLALLRSCPAPVAALVVNNNGGGIFHFLPIAEQSQHFESLFAMPHGLSELSAAAELFEIPYFHPRSPQELRDVLRDWNARPRCQLIEIATERHENVSYHRWLVSLLRAAV